MQTSQIPASVWPGCYYQQVDAVLIQQCLERNEQAWSVLLERYGNLIYSIAWKLKLSPEEVAGVFQSVCLSLIEKLGTLQQEPRLSRWLATLTLHQCLQLRQEKDGDQSPDYKPWLSEEDIRKLEQERLLRQGISTMAEPCQQLLKHVLYDKEAWPCQDMAEEPNPATCGVEPKTGCCLKKLIGVLNEFGF